MDSLISNLLTSVLSVYLPFSDVGMAVSVSLAVTGIITYVLNKLYNYLSTADFFINWFEKKTYCVVISPGDIMHDKIIKHIRNKYPDMILKGKISQEGEKNVIYPIRLKKNNIKEDYQFANKKHTVEISLESESSKDDKDKTTSITNIIIESSHSLELIDSYLNEVIQTYNNQISNKIPIYRIDQRSGKNDENRHIQWKCNITKLSKNIKNTIVAESVQKHFYNDVEKFINSEQYYMEKGIPYKRGYLLYGEPGCGKTSLIKAIANQYKLPIFIIDMSIIKNNSELVKITSNITSHIVNDQKYLVVFEDIDRSKMFSRWGWEEGKITKDCFLNVLDGVDEFHGRITIVTANNIEKLTQTKALVRPGRMDTIVEIGSCTTKQIDAILRFYFGIPEEVPLEIDSAIVITPAQLSQIIFVINDVTQVLKVINKNKNMSSINVEKMNTIYFDTSVVVSEEKKGDAEEEVEEEENSWYKDRLLTQMKNTLKKYNINIDKSTPQYELLSVEEKLKHDKLILTKKLLENNISKMQTKRDIWFATVELNKINIHPKKTRISGYDSSDD